MCDTFIATPSITKAKNFILGKNSDREPNEAQVIVRYPAESHRSGEVKCTYISIPQVDKTNEVILSKPFQMWGAEMGMNQHGLAIGNEAVFTKIGFNKSNTGLTGMDMIRLALERCDNSKQAVELIIDLIETYGQDACGGYYNRNFYYHNSFLIADPSNAWVLESAGKFWVAKEVKEDFYAISNGLTIESDFDRGSLAMKDYALMKRWIKPNETLNFRKTFSDKLYTHFSKCTTRTKIVSEKAMEVAFGYGTAKEILSSHSSDDPSSTDASSICMHGNSFLNPSQSNGSMIAELDNKLPVCWLTGTSNPCMSIYVPYVIGGKTLMDDITNSGSTVDDSLWWKAEQLHRLTIRNYSQLKPIFEVERKNLQDEIVKGFNALRVHNASVSDLDEFSGNSFDKVYKKTVEWLKAVSAENVKNRASLKYRLFMKLYNRKAEIGK